MASSAGSLSWEIVASLWLHLSAAAVLVLFDRCGPTDDEPLFKPNEVMQVQLASAPMPKADRTQRAERAPEPVAAPAPEPEPAPQPTPPPAPASDMVLHQEEDKPDPVETPEKPPEKPKDPPKAKQPPKDNTQDRTALLNQARREELVNQNAPLGTTNRQEGSPDGVEGASANPIGIGEADPVLSAYILACRDAIMPNWTPLPSMVAAHPEYEVIVQVPVAADGTLGSAKIVRSSGDASFDRTAILAVAKTRKLPPPPDVWAASAAKGVQIRLAAKDK